MHNTKIGLPAASSTDSPIPDLAPSPEKDDSILPAQPEPVKPEHAFTYANRGWRVFPLHPESRIPLINDWPNRATTLDWQIRDWAWKWRDAIVGIATGAESNLVVIDVDMPLGEVTLATLEATHGTLPRTLEARTPHGGRHLYLQHPGGYVKSSVGELGLNIDVRGDGGMVVAYPFIRGQEPAEIPPAWIPLLVSEKPQERLGAWCLLALAPIRC